MKTDTSPEPVEYYGMIYKGPLLLPLAGLILTIVGIILLFRKK